MVEWPVAKQCRPKEGGGQLKASGFGWIEELECLSGVAHSSETVLCSDGTRKGGTYLCFAWGPRRLPAFLPTEDFMPALLRWSIYALIADD